MLRTNNKRVREEQIEVHEVPLENGHNWIVLKGTGKLLLGKYYHETAKADLYVALQHLCDSWACELSLDEGVLVPDLTFDYKGTRFHIELDLGNTEARILFGKIERYTQFAGPGEKVIFVFRDGKYKAGVIGTQVRDYCAERRLGNFITGTLFENFVKYPLGDVLISPKDGRISITQLVG